MEFLFWIKGVILGFSIAAPVGPIGVLCIRRTLANGMLNGFLSGFGTASADAIYGCIAAFGITAISTFLLDNRFFLHMFGGLFLLYLGYNTFRAVPAEKAAETNGKGLFAAYTSAFFLTLTNPATIMSFVAVFAGLGIGAADGDFILAGFMVLGVFVGSLLWWLILSVTVNIFRAKFDQRRLKRVNQLSSLIIFAFGVLSLCSI
ncbi:MAG: Lysine exporter protein [Firmicutes bacterium]|nr:Lysine exporter protein [Bacillota bacterium]